MKVWAFLNYWGSAPGLPPKVTPLSVTVAFKTTFLPPGTQPEEYYIWGLDFGGFLLTFGKFLCICRPL